MEHQFLSKQDLLTKKFTEDDFNDMMDTMGRRCMMILFKSAMLTVAMLVAIYASGNADEAIKLIIRWIGN